MNAFYLLSRNELRKLRFKFDTNRGNLSDSAQRSALKLKPLPSEVIATH